MCFYAVLCGRMNTTDSQNQSELPDWNELLTRKQVAQLLKVHPLTISRMTARGELPMIKANRRLVRFRRTDVQKWINERAV